MKDLDRASRLSLSGHHHFQQVFTESRDCTLSYHHSKPYLFMSDPCFKDINKCLLLLLWLRLSSQVHNMVKIRPWWTHSCNLNLCSEHHAIELTISKPRLQAWHGLLLCSCCAFTLGSLVKLMVWILNTTSTIMYLNTLQRSQGQV